MNELEQRIADELLDSIKEFVGGQRRTQQTLIGVSEIGTCREKTRRKILQLPETNPRFLMSSFIGQAVGDWVEQAVQAKWPNAVRQRTLDVDLPSGNYHLPGTPDLIFTAWLDIGPILIDVKTVDGHHQIERDGPSFQQLVQRNTYALGAHQAGVFGDTPVERVLTANVYVDRSGRRNELVVFAEPFSWDVIYEGEAWLDDSMYAVKNGEAASKDKPRNWCAAVCEFFDDCRALDTDVSGRIEDPETVSAVDLYLQGKELAKTGAEMKDQAKALLAGVVGNTDTHSVRWIFKDATTYTTTRKASDTLEIRRLKGAKP